MRRLITLLAAGASTMMMAALAAFPASADVFTYQGELRESGSTITDLCDFRFRLYDAASGGAQVGSTVESLNQPVVDGRITADLDFGPGVFDGSDRWVEIDVRRPAGSGSYVTLAPRQKVQATPYAHHALNTAFTRTSIGDAVFMGGNVGIGTETPDAALQVGDNLYVAPDGVTDFVGVNRDYKIGLEFFGVHAPVNSGYGGMYVSTEGATAWPFYGYAAGPERAWHFVDGGTGNWHLNVDGTRMTVTDDGLVGIGTTLPAHRLHVRSSGDYTIVGEATSTTEPGIGVNGRSASTQGNAAGVKGEITSATGTGAGVLGEAPFYGVVGRANDAGIGVSGFSDGMGVYGQGTTAEGVLGFTNSTTPTVAGIHGNGTFRGVQGTANATTGEVWGVYGRVASDDGFGVYGENTSTTGSATGIKGVGGVYGVVGESEGVGTLGFGNIFGVFGQGQAAGSAGVTGQTGQAGGYGVWGNAFGSAAYAVYATTSSATQFAGYFEGRGYFEGNLGVGSPTPTNRLDVRDSSTSSNVMNLERTADGTANSDMLQIKAGSASSDDIQFIECERGFDVKFRVQGDGDVTADGAFTGGGADYAEWLERLDPAATFEPGDVVGVFGGRIAHRTAGAQQIMVISVNPVLVGNNDPDNDAREMPGHEMVAFIGQTPVRVRGAVNVGDFIIAGGSDDGVAVAVAPDSITAAQIALIVGTAWESSSDTGVKQVNCAIGIDSTAVAAALANRQQSELAARDHEIDVLHDRLAQLETMIANMAAMER